MVAFSKTLTNTWEHKLETFTIEQKISIIRTTKQHFPCKVCDKSIIEIESKFNNYKATLKKEYDKSFYGNYIIINPNLVEIDKTLNDYNTKHNKKFDIFYSVANLT